MSYPQRSWDDGDVEVLGKRLWAGGIATAVVAAGIAIVGVLIISNVFDLGIQTAERSGALVDNAMTIIPVAAAIAALAGTALLHLLLLTTPRPATFFSALVVLALVVLLLQVFLARGSVIDHIATAVLYAAIGLAIISMLSGVSRTAVRPVSSGGWGGRQYDGRYDQRYGTYEQPYEQRGPYADPYPGQDDRTARYDPRGPQGGRWQ
ncbi:hypothetical protein [Actinomycetospora cinnamomea]|uniref:Uncharacterized protein n=1 Tax=Actinomycetospora cinnamomea TaxID=663609 RepID=A0A2U1FBX4_9PSEU|nr:hypothetical protein [Actinomycetospora cinnamomea]PVZ09629.1 hypothetical protein C8D89_106293 [Actinomycetospora cinnamomea]